MHKLEGKVAIITGASSGIGRAAALLFAARGAKLVLSGRREDALSDLVRQVRSADGSAVAVAGDVREEAHAAELVRVAVETFGGLDIAFNNAGASGAGGNLPELDLATWNDTLQTNLTSAFLGAKHQIPAMLARGGGSLVFTSSFVGHTVGFPGMAAYAAAKAGLIGLVQTLAVEYGPHGIRANALLPGGTDTPSNAANQPGSAPQTRAFIEGLHALRRLARPEEVAEAALYLASAQASFVTGAALLVDGGVSVTRT